MNFITNHVQYIRVPTKVEVNYETSQMRSNVAEALVKRVKKPTADVIEKEVAKLGFGLDSFGEKEISTEAIGQQMLKAGPGQGFSGLAQSLPDIKALLPEAEEVEEEAAVQEPQGEGDQDDHDDDDGECDGEGDEPAKKSVLVQGRLRR